MGQNLSMFEQMVEAGANPTMRGPTADDVRADQTSGRPERPGQLDTAGVETLRGPTSEDIRDYADRRTAGETETMRGPTAEDVDNYFAFGQGSLIDSAESEDPAAAAQAGQQVASNVKSALEDPAASEEEKNETALEFLGLKDPGEKLSKKEQIEKNKEFYREVFGVDPEEDKKIDGYNLAMMGFMIASGDSPNALQNIARGAAQGVKGFMKTAEKRQSREDKLTQLAVADYQSQVKSEAAREQFRLDYNLKVQELIDKRDQAKSKAKREQFNAILGAVDDTASALVLAQMDNLDDLATDKGIKQFNAARQQLIASNPDLANKESGFRDRRDPDEVVINYLDAYDNADRLGKRQINQDVASYFGKDPKQVTDFDREKYARDRVSRVYGSDPAPAPAPESVSAPEEVQTFPPMPSDKNALQDGATYNTPRGPATWNASTEQFIAVE